MRGVVKVRALDAKVAVVTGGGSGIGRAVALEAARRGARVFTCDVNEGGLDETVELAVGSPGRVEGRVVDVTSADAMRAFCDDVHRDVEGVDLLVNNAGVALGARFQDTTLEDWRWIVDVNLMGVVHGCHVFVPRMVARGRGGHVVNVASMAGFTPTVATTAYCVTKAGVLMLSECMRIELEEHGIGVTAICPGLIDTPIVRAACWRGDFDHAAATQRTAEIFARRGYTADRAARAILDAVHANAAVRPVAAEAWTLYLLNRAAPGLTRKLSAWLGRRVFKPTREARGR
jgi:NAD(P)-dependent dehydrogenase (short-subunit alcohol dehydrogenase family)